MKREILISASPRESWVALLEDKHLVELMFDRPDQGRLVGDIFLGRVEAVLPGIQAAFVDIGTDKAGFLHASDLDREENGDEQDNGGGRGRGRGGGGGRRKRAQPPAIQDVVEKGQELIVQVTKEAISTKGPRITTQVSLPGRFLVYMPYSSHVGVSRKIEDRSERSRLRKLGKSVVPPDHGGIIIRTVGEELTKEKFEGEFKSLHGIWQDIKRTVEGAEAPTPLHREAKLISGVIRDLFSDKLDALTVDHRETHDEILKYVRTVDPDLEKRVHFHGGDAPLFDDSGIEDQIQTAFRRKVDLPSGGHIIIEPTEALVSIDVNTGRYTGKKKKDPEHTILRTNLDAAREIAKQLRLRDIGGIIVCDFIDMESQENRDRVLHELRSHLGRDRARTKTYEVSGLGLVEMTRQRVRPSLLQSLTDPCTSCGGTGRVWTAPTVVRQIERCLRRAAEGEKAIHIRVHPEVALQVMENEPDFLKRLAKGTRLELDMRDDPLMQQDEFRLLSGRAQTDVTEKYAAP